MSDFCLQYIIKDSLHVDEHNEQDSEDIIREFFPYFQSDTFRKPGGLGDSYPDMCNIVSGVSGQCPKAEELEPTIYGTTPCLQDMVDAFLGNDFKDLEKLYQEMGSSLSATTTLPKSSTAPSSSDKGFVPSPTPSFAESSLHQLLSPSPHSSVSDTLSSEDSFAEFFVDLTAKQFDNDKIIRCTSTPKVTQPQASVDQKTETQIKQDAVSVASENVDESKKPYHSYIALIAKAILSEPQQEMKLMDICKYIEDTFPYYRTPSSAVGGWKTAIRHNLSVQPCFIKSSRSANGRGSLWTVHPACVDDFKKGDYRRTIARRRVQDDHNTRRNLRQISGPAVSTCYSTDSQPPQQSMGAQRVPVPLRRHQSLPKYYHQQNSVQKVSMASCDYRHGQGNVPTYNQGATYIPGCSTYQSGGSAVSINMNAQTTQRPSATATMGAYGCTADMNQNFNGQKSKHGHHGQVYPSCQYSKVPVAEYSQSGALYHTQYGGISYHPLHHHNQPQQQQQQVQSQGYREVNHCQYAAQVSQHQMSASVVHRPTSTCESTVHWFCNL